MEPTENLGIIVHICNPRKWILLNGSAKNKVIFLIGIILIDLYIVGAMMELNKIQSKDFQTVGLFHAVNRDASVTNLLALHLSQAINLQTQRE